MLQCSWCDMAGDGTQGSGHAEQATLHSSGGDHVTVKCKILALWPLYRNVDHPERGQLPGSQACPLH
ncbi:hypothetical protein LEMLEM_LOCUS27708 [Lemmus lemmus]